MILCITPNPAIDRTIILPGLVLGNVYRAQKSIVAAGGKGLNVARAIRTLGGESLCMGFAGGYAGRLLAELAQNEGLHSSWTWTNAETRTCTILVAQNADATVINEAGAPVSKSDWKKLREDVHKHISSAGLVCVSGSFPPDSSVEDLQELLSMLVDSGRQVWMDTSGAALSTVLTYPGICIKVNGDEISESLGFKVRDLASAKRALITLGERGVTACVITLGTAGALLSTNMGRWHAYGPRVRVVSTVGSGDSFLGGFISALDNGKGYPEALRDAVTAGTANTLSAGGGQFGLREFKDIRKQVQIQAW
ncbi:MAG: 1-phosphofructokinase family hexose kinase [Anaerolineae bacterium]|nr:1-phosphofructokinase family hexose kinase [Anaerolineae bacterium]MCI0611015.1 1-phosphofructokinase family hexose kinase [Anaerolineae bacterium]